jgi:hypothetical protein
MKTQAREISKTLVAFPGNSGLQAKTEGHTLLGAQNELANQMDVTLKTKSLPVHITERLYVTKWARREWRVS